MSSVNHNPVSETMAAYVDWRAACLRASETYRAWSTSSGCDEVELIVLPAPNPLQVQPSEFGHASRLMRDALTASRALLARGDPVVSTRRRTALTVALHDIAAG